MTYSQLTASLKSILTLGAELPIYSEYDTTLLNKRNCTFLTLQLKSFNLNGGLISSVGTENNCSNAAVSYKLSIYSAPDALLNDIYTAIEEKIFKSLLSSNINISGITAGMIAFNTKYNRFQADWIININGVFSQEDISCLKEEIPIPLKNGVVFKAISYTFDKTRIISEISSVCGADLISDGGNSALKCSFIGELNADSRKLLVTLDEVIADRTPISLNILGVAIPPLLLRGYSFKGENNNSPAICRLDFMQNNPSEGIGEIAG